MKICCLKNKIINTYSVNGNATSNMTRGSDFLASVCCNDCSLQLYVLWMNVIKDRIGPLKVFMVRKNPTAMKLKLLSPMYPALRSIDAKLFEFPW